MRVFVLVCVLISDLHTHGAFHPAKARCRGCVLVILHYELETVLSYEVPRFLGNVVLLAGLMARGNQVSHVVIYLANRS